MDGRWFQYGLKSLKKYDISNLFLVARNNFRKIDYLIQKIIVLETQMTEDEKNVKKEIMTEIMVNNVIVIQQP